MPDGSIVQWDMANDPKPDCVGNQSRNGFLYNCYTHAKGKLFQYTIKPAITGIIKRVHDKDIPRYDKDAYVYEDPRLLKLDQIIKETIDEVIQDADKDRKREILKDCADISMFMLKEDVFYRPRILQAFVKMADKIKENESLLTEFTDYEQYNLARFGGLDGIQHRGAFQDLSEEERAKLPKHWTDGSVYGR